LKICGTEQRLELFGGSLAAAHGSHHHPEIEQYVALHYRVGLDALWHHPIENDQLCRGCHGAATHPQHLAGVVIVPIVDDVREKVKVSASRH